MAPNTVKELKRLTELARDNRNSVPIKRRIEELQAKLEQEKGRKKAKHQAKKAANPSGLTGREEQLQKVEAAETAAVEKLADAAGRVKRSFEEYTQLQERGASESELAYPWRKVLDHRKKERKAKDELIEAEQKTLRKAEALQRSLADAPSAPSDPSAPSPHPVPSPPGPQFPPSAPSPPPGPSGSPHGKGKGKARAEDDNPRFLSDDDEEDEDPSERLAREAQIEADAELAARMEQEDDDYVDDAGADESDESTEKDQDTPVVESVQASSSRDPPKASAEIQVPAAAKKPLQMPRFVKRATKIFKRNSEEKEEWIALITKYDTTTVRYLMQKNGIPYDRGISHSKLNAAENLFKYLETLPTSTELDEIRKAFKVPSKDQWLEDNWGNEDFDKTVEVLKPRVEAMLRGKLPSREAPLIKDLDVANWKGKENTCVMRRTFGAKSFTGPYRIPWHWAQAIWITTKNKDLAFKSVQDGIETSHLCHNGPWCHNLSHVIPESSRRNGSRKVCVKAGRCICGLKPSCQVDLRIPDERIRQLVAEGILLGNRANPRSQSRLRTESQSEDEEGEEDDT